VQRQQGFRNSCTPDQAFKKLERFCAYQDRCHQEVRRKLYDLGLYGADVDQVMARLIEDRYLDEERFARSFARGKFRMKSWGRKRIERELKQREVSS
jgi:regulatory protein